MISSEMEYQRARGELDYMNQWLLRLEQETPRKSLTTASVRKMISRLQKELAEFETSIDSNPTTSAIKTEPKDDENEKTA
jgi:hypothetical protein